MTSHSVICQSRSAFARMKHVKFQRKPIHNPKSVFVCVCGGGYLAEVMAVMQCAVPKAPLSQCSMKFTQTKCGKFLRGHEFSLTQTKLYRMDPFKVHLS